MKSQLFRVCGRRAGVSFYVDAPAPIHSLPPQDSIHPTAMPVLLYGHHLVSSAELQPEAESTLVAVWDFRGLAALAERRIGSWERGHCSMGPAGGILQGKRLSVV
jgi:hypothetical protein